MADVWKKSVDLPTGEVLDIRLRRSGGEVIVDKVTAHALLGSCPDAPDGVRVHIPLHVRPGGYDFNVTILPEP